MIVAYELLFDIDWRKILAGEYCRDPVDRRKRI
jgi:hypothetical protein